MDDIFIKTADPNATYDHLEYIEHPDLPVCRRNFDTEDPKAWAWITAVVGDIDYGGEEEGRIDVSGMSIPTLFDKRVEPKDIVCLTESQYGRYINKISEERVERSHNRWTIYNRNRYIKKEKNTNKIILTDTNAS